jgi:outer membrane autotransporter protein
VVELPEARPLLSFELERTAQDVDVVARAASFATVTDNPLYRQIAVDLDGIALGSTGDLADLFGSIQNLEIDFDRALASFSPDTHLATSGSVFTNLQEMTRVLQGHLSDTRLRYRHAPHARLPDAVVSFSGGSDGLGMLRVSSGMPMFGTADLPAAPQPQMRVGKAPRSQAWMLGIGSESSSEAVEGYSAFDTDTQGYMLGADRRVGEDWLVGVTLGQAQTDIASGVLARGEIDSWQASAYATWFDESLHFATGLSVGSQDFANTRLVNIAADQRSAISEHDGTAWSAFVSGGMSIESASWAFEPYLSLNYYEAREDGFQETGADGVSQLIDARNSHAFLVEAGANVSYRKSWSGGLIDWHASLALSHDFAFDDGGVTYSYVGAPGSVFSIDGRPVDESGTLYGIGVSFIGDQSTFALDYRGLNNSDRAEKFLSARISRRF